MLKGPCLPSPALPHTPCSCTCPVSASWAPPSGTGSAGRAPARWVLLGGPARGPAAGVLASGCSRGLHSRAGGCPQACARVAECLALRDSKVMPTAPLAVARSNVPAFCQLEPLQVPVPQAHRQWKPLITSQESGPSGDLSTALLSCSPGLLPDSSPQHHSCPNLACLPGYQAGLLTAEDPARRLQRLLGRGASGGCLRGAGLGAVPGPHTPPPPPGCCRAAVLCTRSQDNPWRCTAVFLPAASLSPGE